MHIHKLLKHENVVALLTHHLIDRSIALVLEFCDNGSLRQLLTKTTGGLLTEPVTRRYFLQFRLGATDKLVSAVADGPLDALCPLECYQLLYETQLPQSECAMLHVKMNGRTRRPSKLHGVSVFWSYTNFLITQCMIGRRKPPR